MILFRPDDYTDRDMQQFQCSGWIVGGANHGFPCARRAKLNIGGRWWCEKYTHQAKSDSEGQS